MIGLGATVVVPSVTTCPQCSYLLEGTCVVCGPADPHPACTHCVGPQYKPPSTPWYKNELVLAIMTAVVVGVTSTMITARLERAVRKRRRG